MACEAFNVFKCILQNANISYGRIIKIYVFVKRTKKTSEGEFYIDSFVLFQLIEPVTFARCTFYICTAEYRIGRIFRYT